MSPPAWQRRPACLKESAFQSYTAARRRPCADSLAPTPHTVPRSMLIMRRPACRRAPRAACARHAVPRSGPLPLPDRMGAGEPPRARPPSVRRFCRAGTAPRGKPGARLGWPRAARLCMKDAATAAGRPWCRRVGERTDDAAPASRAAIRCREALAPPRRLGLRLFPRMLARDAAWPGAGRRALARSDFIYHGPGDAIRALRGSMQPRTTDSAPQGTRKKRLRSRLAPAAPGGDLVPGRARLAFHGRARHIC